MIYIYIYILYTHHHTVQVAWVQVEYLHQWLEGKHHQCKLQRVITTTCASGVFAPAAGRKTPPAQGSKVRTSIRASWSGMQQQLMQLQPPPTKSGPAQVPLECLMQQSMQHVLGHIEVVWWALVQVALIAAKIEEKRDRKHVTSQVGARNSMV